MVLTPLTQAPPQVVHALEDAKARLEEAYAAVEKALADLHALSGRTAREGQLKRREIALVRQDAILAHLEKHGATSAADLGHALGLPRHLVLYRLRMLRAAKRVHLLGHTQSARWALVVPPRRAAAAPSGVEVVWSGTKERQGDVPPLTEGLGMASTLGRGRSCRVAL